jgi:Domain of unknown function (DUF4282)
MKEFLTFRRMVTPAIVQVIFWLGTAACILGGLFGIVSAPFANPGFLTTKSQAVVAQLFSSAAVLILGPIAVRIYCELVILVFRMNETLTDIKNGLNRPAH